MKPVPWGLLDEETKIRAIAPCGLLVFTDDSHYLFAVKRERGGGFSVRSRTLGFGLSISDLAGSTTLSGLKTSWGERLADARFMLLPNVVAKESAGSRAYVNVIVAAASIGLAIWLQAGWILVAGCLLTILGLANWSVGWARREILGQKKVGVTLGNVHSYALAVERGELWNGVLPAASEVSPGVQVARIRREYAQLRSDLLYRLENPALFDPEVPTTAAFEEALVEFETCPSRAAADRVEIRFQVARDNAERMGLRHVARGARDEVAKAAKVARLAAGASSDGERAAALARLQRILDSLALHYLPIRVEQLAIDRSPRRKPPEPR